MNQRGTVRQGKGSYTTAREANRRLRPWAKITRGLLPGPLHHYRPPCYFHDYANVVLMCGDPTQEVFRPESFVGLLVLQYVVSLISPSILTEPRALTTLTRNPRA